MSKGTPAREKDGKFKKEEDIPFIRELDDKEKKMQEDFRKAVVSS